MRLTHPEPFDARGHARWILSEQPRLRTRTATRPVQTDPQDRVGLFRRSLHLAAVPGSVPARIWVDGRYVLWVNGEEVARGPVRSDPRSAHYDVVDLSPHLLVGHNAIAITARHFGEATSWWTPVPPTSSLGAGSVVFEASAASSACRPPPGAASAPARSDRDGASLGWTLLDAGRRLAVPGNVPKLSRPPGRPRRNAPARGQETDGVLAELAAKAQRR